LFIYTHKLRFAKLAGARGFQYCSQDYIEILQQNEVKVSMTESGSPYDNAIAERVNGILKGELGLDAVFEDYERAKKAIELAIKRYNKIRPHLSCGHLTPNQAHKARKPLIKAWKQNNKNIAYL
jgi:putative transposase